MTRSYVKFLSEQAARHAAHQIRCAMGNEINPNKTRQAIEQVAKYLHNTCAQLSRVGADERHEIFITPLMDALAFIRQALDRKPLDREAIGRAVEIFRTIEERINSN